MYVLDPIYKVNLFLYLTDLQYGFLGEDRNAHIFDVTVVDDQNYYILFNTSVT